MDWHSLSVEEVVKKLKTDKTKGLSKEEVKIRQAKFGKNKLPEEKPLSSLRIFFEQFQSPLIYILVIAGIVTLIFQKFTDAIVIFGAVFLNIIVGFIQENKASKTLEELKKMVRHEAEVLREGNLKIINSEELVPGDIIILNPGDKVSADGRIVDCHQLKINEAALTGEWLPAKKQSDKLKKETPVADRDNIVYTGTIIEEGKGRAIVIETGLLTQIGKVAQMVKEAKEEKTPYQKKLAHFSKVIGIVIAVICFAIFLEGIISAYKTEGIISKERLVEMFTTSIAVAVASIPEGLPVAMTVILALGMQRILKKKGLVRRLASAETLGSTSIICTDKTGTLTEGRMKVSEVLTPSRVLENKKDEKTNQSILKIATMCIEAFIENPEAPKEKWILRGRPTDRALLEAGIKGGLDKKELEKKEPKIEELPFDPIYKYSASLRRISESENILYVLGAPEKILAMANYFEVKGKREILSEERHNQLKEKFESLAAKGQRILATAYRKLSISESQTSNLEDLCNNLIFTGFIVLRDPLRSEVKEAIRVCQEAGMRPIIVTGDHKLTAKAIAEDLGLPAKEENILEGRDLDKISDEELRKKVKNIEIYTRVEPKHKMRIIDAWQKRGEVVAMTGDGINDAPALKEADIGIALGSGTEVAKETSDLILLNDSFSIIVAAVEEGRAIIDNIRKVITYLLSDSFTEVILVSISILFGLPLPVTAVQILWVNLIEDGLPDTALSFEPKEKDLMKQKPGGHETPLLTQEMKVLIFIIGIFTDILLLGLFFWLTKYSGYNLSHIRSIIFAGLTIDSLFYVFSCKSLRQNIWHINIFSNKFLIFAWIIGVLMLLAALYTTPLQILLKTTPLNLFDWQLVLELGILNIFLIESTKWYFISRKATSN